MQLETMQYFDSTLPNSPVKGVESLEDIIKILKFALIDEKKWKPDSVKGQRLIFNNGHQMNDRTIFEFNDGQNIIKSFIDIIDQTTIEVRNDISALSTNIEVTLKQYEWEYSYDEKSHVFLRAKDQLQIELIPGDNIYLQINGISRSAWMPSDFISRNPGLNKWLIFESNDSFIVAWEGAKRSTGFCFFKDIFNEHFVCGRFYSAEYDSTFLSHYFYRGDLKADSKTKDLDKNFNWYYEGALIKMIPHFTKTVFTPTASNNSTDLYPRLIGCPGIPATYDKDQPVFDIYAGGRELHVFKVSKDSHVLFMTGGADV